MGIDCSLELIGRLGEERRNCYFDGGGGGGGWKRGGGVGNRTHDLPLSRPPLLFHNQIC